MAEPTKNFKILGLGLDIEVTSKMVHEELTNLSVDKNTENREGFSPLIWWLIGRLTEKGDWTPLKAFLDSTKFPEQLHQCVKFRVGATGRCTVPALGPVLIQERVLQIWRWPLVTSKEYESIDDCHDEDGSTCLNIFHYRKKDLEAAGPPPLNHDATRDGQPTSTPTLPLVTTSVFENVPNLVDDNIDVDAAIHELAEDDLLLEHWRSFAAEFLREQN